jgi:catechol 2,3-dioxygenase-like lactoylglutathione lyase family enzyme
MMKPNHVHFHVRDLARSRTFYKRWFEMEDGRAGEKTSFLRSQDGFDLAISQHSDPAPLPASFHFGFKLRSGAHVRELHQRMRQEGIPLEGPLHANDDFALFRCVDPDGHLLELYWE